MVAHDVPVVVNRRAGRAGPYASVDIALGRTARLVAA